MQITIKANFNKQTKDSKKELVQFYVKGEDEKRHELPALTRSVVILSIEGVDAEISAEFAKCNKDSKKTTLEFIVKGDASAAKTFEFYKKAGDDVVLNILESQMSLDEFHQELREGLKGKIGKDGVAELDKNQQAMDFPEGSDSAGDPDDLE